MNYPFKHHKIIRLLASCGLGLLLAACSLAPTPRALPQPRPADQLALGASFDQAAAGSAAEWPGEQWWQALHDPGLDQLLQQAQASSPSLTLAQARLDQALAAAGGARSADGLSGELSASATRERFSAEDLIPPPIAGATFWDNQAMATARYDLDLWGRRRTNLASALDEAHVRRADLEEAHHALVSAISRAWVQLALQYREVALLQDTLKHQTHLADLSHRRWKAGLGTQLEVNQAEAAPPVTQAQIDAAQGHIALLRNQLAALAGQGPGAGEQLPAPVLQLEAGLATPAAIPAHWLGRRPDVIASRWQVEVAARGIDLARTRYYPDINITAFAGFQSLGFGHFDSGAAEAYGATPAISLPIFNRGSLRAGLAGREADYDAAVASYDDTVLKAAQQVADGVAGQRALAAEAQDREKAVAIATQSRDLASAALRAGLGDQAHVLEAETALLLQQQQLLAVQARQLDAAIQLAQAVSASDEPQPEAGHD